MNDIIIWEPGEVVRVKFDWEGWAEAETLTDTSVTAHADLTVSGESLVGYEVTALIEVPETQQIGSELWVRFKAEAGPRKGSRTQRIRVGYRPPLSQ